MKHCIGITEENQGLVGAIPFCGEYPGPGFEDKFRSANQMNGISKAGGDKVYVLILFKIGHDFVNISLTTANQNKLTSFSHVLYSCRW